MFRRSLPPNKSNFSNNTNDELNQLKMKAQAALEAHNKIVANIWNIKYQLTAMALNDKAGSNKESSDKKNKLEEEQKTLEALLKDNFSSEKIDFLYKKIADLEKELNGDFDREKSYFIYPEKSI